MKHNNFNFCQFYTQNLLDKVKQLDQKIAQFKDWQATLTMTTSHEVRMFTFSRIQKSDMSAGVATGDVIVSICKIFDDSFLKKKGHKSIKNI